MDEDWTKIPDAKEKKRIQNRIAQRVHRKKLKSRIRHLEEQLESVGSGSRQPGTSQPLSSLAISGTTPTTQFEPSLDTFDGIPSDFSLAGNLAPKSLMGSDISAQWDLNINTQENTEARLDSSVRVPGEARPSDIQWLFTDSEILDTLLYQTQIDSPSTDGHEAQDHIESSPSKSPLRHLGSSNRVRTGHDSSQSAHNMITATMAQNSGSDPIVSPDSIRLDRLGLLVEYCRRLGFSDLNEALSVYYTSDLSKSAMLSHEQSLSRARQLPSFLSSIREDSKHWPTWQRTNYVRETLRSAEDIYAEECRSARVQLRNQDITGLTQEGPQVDPLPRITRDLQREMPNTWALITSIILHNIIPGDCLQPQAILMVMMLLCYRSKDLGTAFDLYQKHIC